jgi:hypothetical protein
MKQTSIIVEQPQSKTYIQKGEFYYTVDKGRVVVLALEESENGTFEGAVVAHIMDSSFNNIGYIGQFISSAFSPLYVVTPD